MVDIEPAQSSTWGKWLGRSIVSVSLLAGIYICVSVWVGWAKLKNTVDIFIVTGALLIALGLIFLGVAIRAGRWHYYVRHLKWDIGLTHSVMAFLASFALTVTPGKAGEIIKSALLRMRHGVPVAQSAGALLIERLTDLIAIVLLSLGGLAIFSSLQTYAVISVVLLGASVLMLGNHGIYRSFLELIARIRRFERLAEKLLRLLDTTRALLRTYPLLITIAVAIGAWSCEALAFYILTISLLPDLYLSISPLMFFSVFGLATLVGNLAMLPGGVGGFEAVAIMLLTQLGANSADATVIVMLFRLCTIWLISLLGFVSMLLWILLIAPKASIQQQIGAR